MFCRALAVLGIVMYAIFAYVEVHFTRWAFRSSMSGSGRRRALSLSSRIGARSVEIATCGSWAVAAQSSSLIHCMRARTVEIATSALAALPRAQLRIELVADGVAEQAEAEHREADGYPGEDRDPRRAFGIFLRATLQHEAPGGRRLLHAEAEIGQRCLAKSPGRRTR